LVVSKKEFRIEYFEAVNEDVQLGSRYDLPDSLNKLALMHKILGQYDVALFRRAWRSMKNPRSVASLYRHYGAVCFERRRQEYRVNFIGLIELFRGVQLKKLRNILSNGVSWLHRNDREWLTNNLPCL
jgi:hypothetical protein